MTLENRMEELNNNISRTEELDNKLNNNIDNITGRIWKALSGFYYVYPDGDMKKKSITCRARGKFRKDKISPLVGDRVKIRDLRDGTGYIESILPRRNDFVRPAVANLDQLVIVASGAVPKTDVYLIDRMLSVAALKNCDAVLIFNKCDLDRADDLYNIYQASPIKILRTSAVTGEGIDELLNLLKNKFSAFTGNTGVGKSSLLNALSPGLDIQTGEISAALGRGRHTTRHIEIYKVNNSAEIVDTPGFSSFETSELNLELKNRLPETFLEFSPYLGKCAFTGCAHVKETGCAVLEAVRRGEIQQSRHVSYVRLYEELKPLREWEIKNNKNNKK